MQEDGRPSVWKIVVHPVSWVANLLLLLLVGFCAVMLILPGVLRTRELSRRTECMSHFASIGAALTMYKGMNNNRWPWIAGVESDWSAVPVGTNRRLDPYATPGRPGDRSITSLMFLLLRDSQPPGNFICPSNSSDEKDTDFRDATADPNDWRYHWDFSHDYNVSYSWQAPIKGKEGKYRPGLSDNDIDTVVIADKTPRWAPQPWNNTAWDPNLTDAAVRPHMSQNHSGGEVVNALCVGINIVKLTRPDVGINQDMVYTASGDPTSGSRQAKSISIADHLSTRDTFLIGPVPESQGGAEGKGR